MITIILNPDSGPGAGTFPNANYVAGITQLHSYPNARIIGYVHTSMLPSPIASCKRT